MLGHATKDSYEKQAVLYPEKLRAEYAKASERLNLFAGFERYLEMAGAPDLPQPPQDGRPGGEAAPPPQPPFSGGGGNDGLRTTEKQLQDAQTTIQRMTSVMADMARMMHPGAGVPYDPAGAEPEGAQKQDGK